MKRLVADTGPILHLPEANALDLLPLIGEVSLAPLVLAEIRAHAPTLWLESIPHWANAQTLSPAAEQRAVEWSSAELLHGGEAQALALALEIKPDWFITDDAAARLMAESLGIATRGSIGIILWSAAKGLILQPVAERHLKRLEASSLWMSPRVRQEARAALTRIFADD